MKGRSLVIGDIHGAYKALVQVLERCNFVKGEDTLISIGDIVDGWKESPECVELLIELGGIWVRGNHDEWAYSWMKSGAYMTRPEPSDPWVNNGGWNTYNAYVERHFDLIEKHKSLFFQKQLDYYVDSENRLFVHGGFDPEHKIEEQLPYTLLWDRELVERGMSRLASGYDKDFVSADAFKEIFIGHTATTRWSFEKNEYGTPIPCDKPIKMCNLWNIDTGAGWSGKLTIMDVDTKEYWQSDNVLDLYPDVVGRGGESSRNKK